MGWVKDRFNEHLAYAAEVPRLWNRMRDNVGEAVVEFNERTAGTGNTLDQTDCMAKGKYCTRIHKAIDNSSIEVYLDEGNRSLNVSREGRTAPGEICRYRITEDHKGAEFFVQEPHETALRAISVDEACQRAIAEFIFTPFPASNLKHV
jgi:hypothetical protein